MIFFCSIRICGYCILSCHNYYYIKKTNKRTTYIICYVPKVQTQFLDNANYKSTQKITLFLINKYYKLFTLGLI